jgi:hypothetical protein
MEIPNNLNKQPALVLQDAPHSQTFKIIVAVLLEMILLTGAFWLGITVGVHKAGFGYSWSQNYNNNFGGSRMPVQPPPGAFNPHGLDGTILSVGKNGLVIKDEDSNEQPVLISPQTVIRQNLKNLQPADLKTGQEIVIIGEPNLQGQINAKLIRILGQN